MPEITLEAEPPLSGYRKEFDHVCISSVADFALVSIALPLGEEAGALKAIKASFGAELPDPGRYVRGKEGQALIRTGPDQALVMFTHSTADAARVVADKLKDAAYLTDQSDVWVALDVEGKGARTALERICPLDLHPDSFSVEMAQRTVMEHLGVLILRTDDNSFRLLSASSSAKTFAHAVEVSARNTAA